MMDIEDIEDLIDPNQGIEPIDINVAQISEESKLYVISMIENLSKFYYDDEFMKSHPVFKKRVDADIDSLIILIKMRKIDEVTQDSIIHAISNNSNNASLYRALTEIQRTILNIQTKIDETIKNLNLFMKGYQLEIDYNQTTTDESDDEYDGSVSTTRGSKEFIIQMRNNM